MADLDRLPARRRTQVLRKIERLQQGLHGNIKRLQQGEAAYRLRMGDYRVLFDVAGRVIVIRRIGDRKDVYD
jgi:mRNA interferase RelE/StbE